MAKHTSISIVLIAFALLAGCMHGARQASAGGDRASSATSFAQCLVDGQFEQATASFDAVMQKALPADQLQQTWQALLKQCGALKSLGKARSATEGVYEMVYIPCEFEKATLDIKLVFDKDDTIGGLWFVPHVSFEEAQYTSAGYVRPDSFTEQEVTIGSAEWRLPGTLAVPAGTGPFPALVLVHGSGPNDRDESIGANKPFCDLAQGLASQGIAVLRYDKRTKVYAAKIAASAVPFTVKEEVIDDALAAVELLRHTANVDPKKIFVLGHSLGGMLIPRIGQADRSLAGLIVMAGPTRPLEDLMLEQMIYLASLSGAPSAEANKQLDEVRRQIATVKSPDLAPSTAASLALGAPGCYWLDLRGYSPAEAAKSLAQPLLILQGARDYQVTLLDYDGWVKALSGRPDVSLKLYPGLNHLFMEGSGKSTPEEYNQRGPVPLTVIEDVANWIKSH
jgi:uncharacterized protein